MKLNTTIDISRKIGGEVIVTEDQSITTVYLAALKFSFGGRNAVLTLY